jgi:ABC-2 type transport system permease protein
LHKITMAGSLVLLLPIAIFVAFGGDPIPWVLGGISAILGGAYFPTDVMPAWMQKLSYVIAGGAAPTILWGANVLAVARPLVTLLAIAVVLSPVSAALFCCGA